MEKGIEQYTAASIRDRRHVTDYVVGSLRRAGFTRALDAALTKELRQYFQHYRKELADARGKDIGEHWYGSGLYIRADRIQAILDLIGMEAPLTIEAENDSR